MKIFARRTSARWLAGASLALLGSTAAQAAPAWLQPAYGAGQTWSNPQETTLRPDNVARLHVVSTQSAGRFYAGPTTQSDGMLYLCTDSDGLSAYDLAGGALLWSRFGFGGGNCNAAVLDADSAIVSASRYVPGTWTNTLTSVSRTDGANQWQVFGPPDAPFPAASYLGFNTPTLYQGTLFVSNGRSLVSAYAAANGRLRWRAATGLLNNQATVAAGMVFTTTWGGDVNALFAHRAADGALAWSQPTDSSNMQYPAAAVAGKVYAGSDSGMVRAFDAATGAPLWQAALSGYVSAPIVATSAGVIVNTGLATLTALAARDGATLWATALRQTDRVSSNLVVANDVLYVATTDFSGVQSLNAFDARTGRRIVRLAEPIEGSQSNLSVAGGRVYVSDSGGTLKVYGLR